MRDDWNYTTRLVSGEPWRESPWADRPSYARYSDTFRHALCRHDGTYQTHTLAEHVEQERDRALDFLARLLDDWCEDMGLDPDKTWRDPRIAESRARMVQRGEITPDEPRVVVCEPVPPTGIPDRIRAYGRSRVSGSDFIPNGGLSWPAPRTRPWSSTSPRATLAESAVSTLASPSSRFPHHAGEERAWSYPFAPASEPSSDCSEDDHPKEPPMALRKHGEGEVLPDTNQQQKTGGLSKEAAEELRRENEAADSAGRD